MKHPAGQGSRHVYLPYALQCCTLYPYTAASMHSRLLPYAGQMRKMRTRTTGTSRAWVLVGGLLDVLPMVAESLFKYRMLDGGGVKWLYFFPSIVISLVCRQRDIQ